MIRYLVFAGDECPHGGAGDFKRAFNSEEEADAYARSLVMQSEYVSFTTPDGTRVNRWQLVPLWATVVRFDGSEMRTLDTLTPEDVRSELVSVGEETMSHA